jgi:pSer/pThr/pTyr-binding forkhead associated (FHA) protein
MVGRSLENDISFPTDKSMSRNHAKIVSEPNALSGAFTLKVIDLNSKFGTFENGAKLSPETPIEISSGDVIQFGVSSKILFRDQTISFCMTRLEKRDKDRLRNVAKLIGGKIVSNAEDATHVVANKCAATIKALIALVMQRKMITCDWLSFAESNRPAEMIPKEEEYVNRVCCRHLFFHWTQYFFHWTFRTVSSRSRAMIC